MKAWRFFPRSLRQLVLMAFLLVLLPLLVLAWQAWESLSALSDRAADTNRTTLTDVRRSEVMARIALELERSYRQYCVLDDPMLANLYQTQRSKYAQLLDAQVQILSDSHQADSLRQSLASLSQITCENNNPLPGASAALEAFSASSARLAQSTREVVFSRGLQLQREIAERGQYFGRQALILFLLSVGLVLLFTRMIIDPVKAVERMVNRLGEGRSLSHNLAFIGPRELRSLGQRILWLSERLAWLESQRHEFLRHISHELKTPLASMREGTALLADEVAGPLTVDQQEVVSILDESSRHLQRLIEQLIDYNRKFSESPIVMQPVQLAPLVEKIVITHGLTARAKKMQTEITLSASVCLAEANLLSRIIDNLYSNAIHYGAESGTIWIRSGYQGRKVIIEVANSGTPVPQAEQAMIFEPFFQGSQQRKGAVKGSGLGLSIARECVHRLQGDIRLVKSDTADVCFRIELNTIAGKESS
ncbi:HAMP domain-containing histidine kinase [Erwinia tracheiphila]|uniref:histidine kinase n=1 Tax=Erwinia tracheiphila TaxID=65700 RepID=A0A0M2K5J4_9GAMM|nr:HAMP domain-containing sensor histidine kinase [Erwinia tracheiphila]AXF74974.1 sensor histidine kinase [Erwinia tracheiphila]EOS94365.1 sensory histidine kinase GlrK [Erwinia tracheiphila PSU-1]KKF34234.1 histidine kinase [Erwinia tracheiphila]UIA82487.1 HAMP domain-containing histidine kinase [Erwinia tracheiphila]UIA89260.1 HAMP domain-containing histidine kinase [Erwinia tracheiphila]